MPLFEYVCAKCGHAFETLVRIAEETPACPKCGAKRSKKPLSAFAAGRAARTAPAPACSASGGCPMAGGGCSSGMCGLN